MIKELSKALIEQILEEFPQLQTLNLSNNGKPPLITTPRVFRDRAAGQLGALYLPAALGLV
jgi:hypothetical protein